MTKKPMTQSEIDKQIDDKQLDKFCAVLQAIYQNKPANLDTLLRFNRFASESEQKKDGFLSRIFGKKTAAPLSRETAELGLWLLNGFEKQQTHSWYSWYGREIYAGDKRFKALQEKFDLAHLWDGEHYDLLRLIFGEQDAKWAKLAWQRAGSFMYQTGYARRSFRRPNDPQTAQLLQVNTLIKLIVRFCMSPFTLKEYLEYDVALHNGELLLAVAMEQDESLYALAGEILQGKAENGSVSRNLIKALLLMDKPKAWEQVGNLLLAAQRQEGLRQTIVECLDETSIGAFAYMLGLIQRENLSRFSSVVRAIDVWAGFGWEAEKQSTVKRFVQLAEKYVSDPALLAQAIHDKDNAEVYMALWGQGAHDVDGCYPYLQQLYDKGSIEKKSLALYFIYQTGINRWQQEFALKALYEEAPLLRYWGITLFSVDQNIPDKAALFSRLETLYAEAPKKPAKLSGKIFSWLEVSYSQEAIGRALIMLTEVNDPKALQRIMSYYDEMAISNREYLVSKMLGSYSYYSRRREEPAAPNPAQRDFALRVIGDRSATVRSTAIRTLKQAEISEEELRVFEDMLRRKSAEFRQFVLEMIQKRSEEEIFASAERLLHASTVEQRLAGLDLLTLMQGKKQGLKQIQALVADYEKNGKIGRKEQVLLDALQVQESNDYTPENGFGLCDPMNITPAVRPQTISEGPFYEHALKGKYPFGLSKPLKQIEQDMQVLHDLYLANKDYEYTVETYSGSKESVLLGQEFSAIKRYSREDREKLSARDRFANYPLPEVWEEWLKVSQWTAFDLFIVCYAINLRFSFFNEDSEINKAFPKTLKRLQGIFPEMDVPEIEGFYYHSNPLKQILEALRDLHPFTQENRYFLDGWQYGLSQIDAQELQQTVPAKGGYYARGVGYIEFYYVLALPVLEQLRNAVSLHGLQGEEFARGWALHQYVLQNVPEMMFAGYQPAFAHYAQAYTQGLCNRDELITRFFFKDALELVTASERYKYQREHQKQLLEQYPFLAEITEQVRDRLLEIELRRGDSGTPASVFAQYIRSLYGVDYLIQILNGLGKDTLNRGYYYNYGSNVPSKKQQFSQFLKSCFPDKDTSQKVFDEKIKAAGFSEKRLIEVAMYAQQWLPYVQSYLDWEGLDSAVWWLHAHTSDGLNAEAESEIAKYSAIPIKRFADGVVDYHWFQSVYSTLGKTRWQLLYNAAKYISDGNGHSRAKLYADVMLGNTKIREVTARVKDKRNKDYLRMYGLVPLSKTVPDKDLLARYNYLLQFKQESKQFGAQRQASEGLAVEIAMENLAFTAGYPDPIRLTWAMETEEAKTIMANAEALHLEDYVIELTVNEQGKSAIVVTRNGKTLKSIPGKFNKDKAVTALKDFHSRLKAQYSRSRKSLEEAMVRGDDFQKAEIQTLMEHPVIAPMLKTLVLISENGIGFYQDGQLVSPTGEKAETGEKVRLAHCTDLHKAGVWAAYQHHCFAEKIVQPFKQVFRELYLPTEDELKEKTISRRYAGHQVQPKQTVALLKARGWTVDYEEGLQKVFHKHGFIAKIYAMADWFSPSDVESPTLETVEFIDRKTYKGTPFSEIDPRIFSEIMRDLDLVVSVAHVGGVDPEASQSSIELRSVIVEETVRLFKFDNVTVKGNHALIDGKRADYSVHLGSGVVHLRPGSYLSILPVHSQHRGRLFLPFVDEDPKTAEILAKILLLAKDKEIKDPTILRQLP